MGIGHAWLVFLWPLSSFVGVERRPLFFSLASFLVMFMMNIGDPDIVCAWMGKLLYNPATFWKDDTNVHTCCTCTHVERRASASLQ